MTCSAETYRAFHRSQELREKFEEMEEEFDEEAANRDSEELEEQVRAILDEHDDLRWDDAIQIVLDETQLDRVRAEKQKAKKKSGDFTDADEDDGDDGEGMTAAVRFPPRRMRRSSFARREPATAGSPLQALTAGCADHLMKPEQWRAGYRTILGFRCARCHDRRRACPYHARCCPAFLGRAEPPPLEP